MDDKKRRRTDSILAMDGEVRLSAQTPSPAAPIEAMQTLDLAHRPHSLARARRVADNRRYG